MSFDWKQLLSLAEHLSETERSDMRGHPETYFRASVSRAYYSCHTTIRDWMNENTQFTPETRNAHKQLINKVPVFIASPYGNRINWQLDSLRKERVAADYNLESKPRGWTKERADDAIEQAKSILDDLSKSTPSI